MSSLKIIGLLHFWGFLGPTEKNYNLQSLWITLYHFWASTSYLGGELLGLLVYQPMHYNLSSLEVGKFKLHASFSLGLLVSDENICGALSQIIIFRLIVRKKWVLTLKNFKNVYFHGKIKVQ